MKKKVYTKEDLKVFTSQDGLEFIRSHPEMYSCDVPNILSHLANELVSDAGHLNISAQAIQKNDWYIVYADKNWLEDNFKALSEKELFFYVVPMPEAGINSMRSEILVNAFAANISLFKNSIFTLVKGNQVPEDISDYIKQDLGNSFAVIFNQQY